MSDAVVDHAIATGRLFPVFRGAYSVGHPGVGRHGRLLAAILACGTGSVLTHGTAAALLGLWERYPRLIDVVAPVQAGRKIEGIRRRHTPLPPPSGHRFEHGIPCADPSHAIVDIAGIASEKTLRRTVERAAILGVLDVPEIDSIVAGARRRGSPLLRSVLEGWRGHTPGVRIRSPLEAKLLQMLTLRDMPTPECNVELRVGNETFEVDFLWRRTRVIVEADGAKFHDNPQAERRDRRRDYVLTTAGYRVHRLRWHDLEERPEAAMHDIAGLLKLGWRSSR